MACGRRRLLELADTERELSAQRPLSIALFDLDRFKQINGTHGHQAGDAVIRRHCRQGERGHPAQHGKSIEQWLSRADRALDEADRGGRNRCASAT